MVWQAREHVSEPGLRIDGVELGRGNQSVDSGGTTTAFIGAGEGPVLTSDGDSPQFTFGGVVGQTNPSVIQKAREGVPAGEDVIDGLGRVVVLRQCGALLVEPSLKLSRERPTALLAHTRQPHPRPARDRDHRRRWPFARAFISAVTVGAGTGPVIRMRPPVANSTSITPARSEDTGCGIAPASGAIATGVNAGAGASSHSCCRHRNNWLVWIPADRATSEAIAPGSIATAMIRSFSARDHRRRRCADVITSTCVLVIALVLVIVLGLHSKAQNRKASLSGCLRPSCLST